jgi:hypothetical protein
MILETGKPESVGKQVHFRTLGNSRNNYKKEKKTHQIHRQNKIHIKEENQDPLVQGH